MLSKNISRMRKARGLTQVELAKSLHVTQSAVSHWESGRSLPDTVQLFQIAEFFGVSIDTIKGENIPATVLVQNPETQSRATMEQKKVSTSEAEEKLIQIFRELNEDNRLQAVRYFEFLRTLK